MSTIEQALQQAERMAIVNATEEQEYQYSTQYLRRTQYVSDNTPIEIANKEIQSMDRETSVKGEAISQYIEFRIDRYQDGVDLLGMLFNIHYEKGTYGGENRPINVRYNDTKMILGWAIPSAAVKESGILNMCIWATGKLYDDIYVWKTKPKSYVVNDGLTIAENIAQPDDNWYVQFVNELESKIQEFSGIVDDIAQVEENLSTDVQIINEKYDSIITSAETAEQFAANAQASEQNAKESEENAQLYKTQTQQIAEQVKEETSELTGKVEELNSNLDGLGYGENGAYNLLKVSEDNVLAYGSYGRYKLTDDGFITTGTCLIGFIVKVKPNTKYFYGAIGNNCANANWRIREYSSKPTSWNDSFIIQPVDGGYTDGISTVFTTSENTQYIIACKYEENANAVISQMQITESDIATPYKPYIPSVKMLAEENAQQSTAMLDAKMLGWSVPKECPIQNYVDSDGVFHQRVGRVDLGSLTWAISDGRLYSTKSIIDAKPVTYGDEKAKLYTEIYDTISPIEWYRKSKKGIALLGIGYGSDNSIGVYDSSYTDAATFKEAMQGVYLYYELAEEKTISVDGNEAVTKINDSLGDYGLDNQVGNIIQGYYDDITGLYIKSIYRVCTEKMACKSGDIITIVTDNTNINHWRCCFYKSDGSFLSCIEDAKVIAPTDATSYSVSVGRLLLNDSVSITVENVGHIGVYINNQIDILKNDLMASNAGAHNCIYRGKYLGSAVTDEQYSAISNGTFEDLYVGDYWEVNGVNWRIAAFDYYLNCSDTSCTTHHAVIVPDTCLYNHVMNDTNVTTGGYVGSKMYTEGLEQAKTTIKAAFSGHVLSHRIYLTNATANGKASAGVWCDSEVDLMNEQMVYGTGIFSPVSDGSTVPANYRVEKSQFPLFAHEPSRICNRSTWWLRDVITAACFARVATAGDASCYNASHSGGVRPTFCIK